jgi:hypothetical protein
MCTFKIYDMTGSMHWELRYTPTSEPQFETVFGTSHVWLWNMFSGSLLKDGSPDLLGGGWSITIERTEA